MLISIGSGNNERNAEINIGDRIIFRAICRWKTRSTSRIVRGFRGNRPLVRFAGYDEFLIRSREITDVIPRVDPQEGKD